MSKVFYQVLSTGSMRAEHLHVGMLCSKRGALVGVAFGHRGYMANSRNMAIQAFLRTDSDVLIQCDEDVIPPLNILNLAAHGKDLIGTIATHASSVGPAVNSAPLPGDGPTFPMERGDDPLRKVAWFGTGCYSITRAFAEKMIAAYGAVFHQENTKDGLRGAGVDVVMCRRARMLGIDAWIDRSMICGHNKDLIWAPTADGELAILPWGSMWISDEVPVDGLHAKSLDELYEQLGLNPKAASTFDE